MTYPDGLFTAWWQNYDKNHRDGEQLRVVPARLNRDRQSSEAGVAVFIDHKVTLVLTTAHALKLADGIVDALESETP